MKRFITPYLSSIKCLSIGVLSMSLVMTSCSPEEIQEPDEQEIDLMEEELSKAACEVPYEWLRYSQKGQYARNSSNWKLQHPTSTQTYEKKRTDNSSLTTYSNSRFRMVGSTCNRLQFTVYAQDATSGNSSNPRCELREMTKWENGQEDEAAWSSNTSSTKSITARVKVTHVSTSGRVGVVQYHSGQDENVIVIVRKSGSQYKLAVTGDGINGNEYVLDSDYQLGTYFTIKIEAKDNKTRWKYNSNSFSSWKTITNSTRHRRSTCYFKAGVYNLSTKSTSSGYSRAEFTEIKVNRSESL
ncbi:polysaccharide lyase family 7 protein [Nonlabens xiamenensis]|uniref:polysaccharide lyase family 7 protein n=1 Tax=Nonlabens xiamenensis TaxID=2341043 RepID=UPI000F60B753|nr:polysaccharide lyase family 7 protein [Nonlabens xiamenensis]